MIDDSQEFETIERYLQKEMDAGQKALFEGELTVSDRLRETTRLHTIANELIIENRLQDVSKIFINEHERAVRNYKITKWALLTFFAVTVAFIVYRFAYNFNEKGKAKIQPVSTRSINLQPEKEPASVIAQSSTKPPIASKKELYIYRAHKEQTITENRGPFIDTSILPTISSRDNSDSNVAQEGYHPCTSENIFGHAGARNACEGKDDGSIFIYGMQGGKAPYTFTVKDSLNTEKDPSQLFAGTYTVTVSDSRKCVKVLDRVVVPAKQCAIDYAFNPFLNEQWEIPVSESAGKLIIYDNAGNVYFEQQIPGGMKETWSGKSKSGETNIGYYIFIISYPDGTEKQGSITIVQ